MYDDGESELLEALDKAIGRALRMQSIQIVGARIDVVTPGAQQAMDELEDFVRDGDSSFLHSSVASDAKEDGGQEAVIFAARNCPSCLSQRAPQVAVSLARF